MDVYVQNAVNLFQILVIVATIGLTVGGVIGSVRMKQEFDPFWFFPSDSYPRAYLDTEEFYFPADGVESAVYMGKLIHYTG